MRIMGTTEKHNGATPSSDLTKAACWAIMIYLVSAINDVIAKFLGDRLHWIEIAFFRFFLSTLTITCQMLCSWSERSSKQFRTKIHSQHAARGILGAVALGLCCLSVNSMPLAENTTILFSEALFMLPLSAICLKEKLSKKTVIAASLGFVGLLIICKPSPNSIDVKMLIPTLAALLFAYMNIMIKKMVNQGENSQTMLFYFGAYATAISAMALPFFWCTPNLRELLLLIALGLGANAIQVCIFCAYRSAKASKLSPIRFIEMPFAATFGYLFFEQVPDLTVCAGAVLIVIGVVTATKS
ncbi:MAG: DMT family transporter [Holosporales bacterium]|jgi:S-adenosylmethionine uptake transporter|nr:DMT family transporter [Holosporales bacterium]